LKWWIVPWAFGLGILCAGITVAAWALLGLGVILGSWMPGLRVMVVGAVATLVLIAITESRPVRRWLVSTFRRHGSPTASLAGGRPEG
jgi:hypothetical protein